MKEQNKESLTIKKLLEFDLTSRDNSYIINTIHGAAEEHTELIDIWTNNIQLECWEILREEQIDNFKEIKEIDKLIKKAIEITNMIIKGLDQVEGFFAVRNGEYVVVSNEELLGIAIQTVKQYNEKYNENI